jgi:hypothetical protein
MFELDLSLMKLIHHGDDEHSQADALVKTEWRVCMLGWQHKVSPENCVVFCRLPFHLSWWCQNASTCIGHWLPRGDVRPPGVNFVPRGDIRPTGVNLVPRGELGSQEWTWFPGVNLVPRGELGSQGWTWFPGVNLVPRGELCSQGWRWPPGVNFVPKGELCSQGWTLFPRVNFVPRGELCSQGECSPLL